MIKKFGRCRVNHGAPGHFAPPCQFDPARFQQDIQSALRGLHAADCFNLGSANRFMIGDNRQHFGRGPAETPNLLAFAPQKVCKIGSGFKMPAFAALHQIDAALFIMLC